MAKGELYLSMIEGLHVVGWKEAGAASILTRAHPPSFVYFLDIDDDFSFDETDLVGLGFE